MRLLSLFVASLSLSFSSAALSENKLKDPIFTHLSDVSNTYRFVNVSTSNGVPPETTEVLTANLWDCNKEAQCDVAWTEVRQAGSSNVWFGACVAANNVTQIQPGQLHIRVQQDGMNAYTMVRLPVGTYDMRPIWFPYRFSNGEQYTAGPNQTFSGASYDNLQATTLAGFKYFLRVAATTGSGAAPGQAGTVFLHSPFVVAQAQEPTEADFNCPSVRSLLTALDVATSSSAAASSSGVSDSSAVDSSSSSPSAAAASSSGDASSASAAATDSTSASSAAASSSGPSESAAASSSGVASASAAATASSSAAVSASASALASASGSSGAGTGSSSSPRSSSGADAAAGSSVSVSASGSNNNNNGTTSTSSTGTVVDPAASSTSTQVGSSGDIIVIGSSTGTGAGGNPQGANQAHHTTAASAVTCLAAVAAILMA